MSDLGVEHTANSECINVISDKDILIYAAHNCDSTIDNNDTQTVHVDRKITVNGKHDETIKGDTTIKITAGKLDHDVVAGTAKYHVTGAVTELFDDKQETTVNSDILVTSKTTKICLTAATEIVLEVGSSKLTMKADGSIKLEGINISIIGTTSVTVKGGIVHSEADSEHQTKGAIVLSEGSATNTVKGGMVMLNP